MDVVRAGLNLIPFLLTVQSARPCTWELKKKFLLSGRSSSAGNDKKRDGHGGINQSLDKC